MREPTPPRFMATNILSTPLLMIYDAELSKDFFLKHNSSLTYDLGMIGMLNDIIGSPFGYKGVEIHKKRRAVISKIFNFDFLKSIIPQIAEICRRSFDNMEQKHKSADLKNVEILTYF